MENKQIIWESKHYEFNPCLRRLEKDDDDNSNLNSDDELEDLEYADQNFMQMPIQQGQSGLSLTPFGAWYIDDSMHPYKQFRLWMGHTNFNISRRVLDIIRKTPGIELVSVISRYRFLIGIGQLFDFSRVRVDIERQLCFSNQLPNIKLNDGQMLSDVVNLLKTNHNEWAIYVFPNGSYQYTTPDEPNYNSIKGTMKESQSVSQGYYFDSSMI